MANQHTSHDGIDHTENAHCACETTHGDLACFDHYKLVPSPQTQLDDFELEVDA
jgi:hypothetical protein